MSALDDRRQRAREAYADEVGGTLMSGDAYRGSEAAIETATRVRITPEMIEAFGEAWRKLNYEQAQGREPAPAGTKRVAGLRAAFEAAGFEVEE